MLRTAEISPDGRYRYTLGRRWNEDEGTVAFVMLNPSTADANVDDATIRRCVGFARSWGYGAIDVVNLYAYRATDPRELVTAARRGVDIVGPDNDRVLLAHLSLSQLIVAAWGTGKLARRRAIDVTLQLPTVPWQALGTTQDGSPRHPLYVRSAAELASWRF